ncbi:unnamed protein product [Allacma fusca]|uniref:von Hippel-Lindau disease tumour suppressor beta domain-containing protein n=1 Tax=Allacma fusca TaxID=39272 RepID=A0A8J2MDG9_9HEXA|nr:unnamed protein product [Allacma fusca]
MQICTKPNNCPTELRFFFKKLRSRTSTTLKGLGLTMLDISRSHQLITRAVSSLKGEIFQSTISCPKWMNPNKKGKKLPIIGQQYGLKLGVRVKYKTLEPNEYFDVTSFVNHPWIFRDSETQTKLVVRSQEVYDCPEPVYVKLREGMLRPTRSLVTITLPVYSLQECAMQAIQRALHTPEDAYKLEIPVALQKELHHRCSLTLRIRKPLTVTK